MRDLDSFSEFQLGLIKTWADNQDAQILVRKDKKLVHIIKGKVILAYWNYGEDPCFWVGTEFLTLEAIRKQIDEMTTMFSESLLDVITTALENLSDFFNEFDGDDL